MTSDSVRQQNSVHNDDAAWAKVFNTALISTVASNQEDYFKELSQLMKTPAFRAILEAIRMLSEQAGLSEKDAATQVIQTFRKVDHLWSQYLSVEGIERLKSR